MARPSTILVVFFVAMNVIAFAMLQMGVVAAMGLDGHIQSSDEIPDNPQDVDPDDNEYGVETGSGVGGTLFGMYNVLSQQVSGVFSAIFPALRMLDRAGTPEELINGAGTLFGFVIFFDVLGYIRGYDL